MPDKGKTLDVLDVVQGLAEDKVVGVGRGTRLSPRRQRLGYVRKQANMRTALDAKLAQLQSVSGIQDAVTIAKVENQVKDVVYHQGQEVPYNLTDSEKLEYGNESKTHSQHVATLEKHRGNVYALIY